VKSIDEIELYRVKDVRMDFTLINQWAGIGTIGIDSSDETTRQGALVMPCRAHAADRREELRRHRQAGVEKRRVRAGCFERNALTGQLPAARGAVFDLCSAHGCYRARIAFIALFLGGLIGWLLAGRQAGAQGRTRRIVGAFQAAVTDLAAEAEAREARTCNSRRCSPTESPRRGA
jgi:hypothetical protein